ncbi:MAG: hypothetical protein KKI09_10680 [Spirochaetes bacterium]|nr:hypothetical protein [Spirochaetota bacterium]
MKFSAIFAVLVLLLSACVSGPQSEQIETVAAVPSDTVAAAQGGAVEEVPAPVLVKIYSLSKETVSYADGVVDRTITYEYDSDHRLVKRSTYSPSRPEPVETLVNTYLNGQLVESAILGTDGKISSRITRAYNADSALVEESLFDEKGILQTRSVFSWEASQQAGWQVFDGSGQAQARTEYLRNTDGSLQKSLVYNGAGILLEQVEYSYLPDGRADTVVYLTPQGTAARRIVYNYNIANEVEEVVYRSVNRLERRQVSVLGSEGEVLERRVYDASGKLREQFRFEYDYREEYR